MNDWRLDFLEKKCVTYYTKWYKHCLGSRNLLGFLSKETYETPLLTSRSTAACIRYLLQERHFKYVLTRKFSTDHIEMMFGSIRGMAGGNNKVEVPSATFAWDKIARTQLVYSSNEYNVPLRKEKRTASKLIALTKVGPSSKLVRTRDYLSALEAPSLKILDELHREPSKIYVNTNQ